MWFTRVSLQNPVFATMVMALLVVLGYFSIGRLQIDQFPNVDLPVVVVSTDYPGASPEVVESEVSKKIETAVNSVAGINAVTSRSYDGTSVVIIEFQLHVQGRKAADDVREKVAAIKPNLRSEVKEPRVMRFDPASQPIWTVAVLPQKDAQGKTMSAVELSSWADQVLRKRLENVRGVGAVTMVGSTRREINIYLNPVQMEAYGISADQVVAAVRGENQDLPAGAVRSLAQERIVQIEARMEQPRDFNNIIVARKAGAVIRLDQLARVVDGAQEMESLALYNGTRSLMLSVQKSQDENTIAVVDGLEETLKQVRESLQPEQGSGGVAAPAPIRLESVNDNSRAIRMSVKNVRQTLIEGALLTILIVFMFLNSWRSTVITGLTLPIALISTFFFMSWFGFTINMVTLMALSLCVGLLIDDAIVVRENIVRHVQMGKDAYSASMDGTQEIGLAVLATTFSIVAVFLPIGFMGGIIGKFFHQFGITIVAAVLVSMFVSFTLDPMMSSVWHDPDIAKPGNTDQSFTEPDWYDRSIGRLTRAFDRGTTHLEHTYQKTLSWALQHRMTTVLGAVAIFALSIFLLRFLGTEFVPQPDFSETRITFYTPVGSSLEATEEKARQIERVVREYPEVRYTLTTINTGVTPGKNNASIYVRLVDRKERSFNIQEMSLRLRERLSHIAGITVTHVGLLDAVGGNKQMEFSLTGADQHELERLASKVLEQLRDVPGLVDLDSSYRPNKPTLAVSVRREAAADTGLSVAQIGAGLRALIAGQTVGNWRDTRDQTYDVNVRLAPEARDSMEDLERLPLILNNSDGSARVVRLNQVAQVKEATGPNQINRRDLQREVAFNANVATRSMGEVKAEVERRLSAMKFPPGYGYQFSGSAKNMQESFQYALSALTMAIIFIYMILASQFKSFLQPLSLMSSLPLTMIGVVITLKLFGSALSMFSVIGIVMLMGLVTKNAILLIDFATRMRATGMQRSAALLEAAKVRLRPILMTTLAMIFGMMPLAFAMSEGAEQRAPLGQAVMGGVITSSILTLVVVPVIYCYIDDYIVWVKDPGVAWWKKYLVLPYYFIMKIGARLHRCYAGLPLKTKK